MELTFFGVRGSYPVARRDQLRYGGNSTCLHLRSASGQELILDGGSGIRLLGDEMMGRAFGTGRGTAILLISHTHWDHILGLPFFTPFYQAGNRFVIIAPGGIGAHIRDILSGQQNAINFPISMDHFQARLEYMLLRPSDPLVLGTFRVQAVQLNHPGLTVGYRIEADECAVTVFTDAARVREVRLGTGMGGPRPDDGFTRDYLDRLVDCARDADVLVHDAHFFEHEIRDHYHYGHSTVEDALEIAHRANVGRLFLFHHHPQRSDLAVDEQEALARDLCRGTGLRVDAAQEGARISVVRSAGTQAVSL